MRAIPLVIIAGCVLALTACSPAAPEELPTSSTPPSATSTPTRTPTTISLDRLQTLYVVAGGQCNAITPRSTSVAEEAGDCEDGALLTTYHSQAQRDNAIRILQGTQDSNPSPSVIAVGPDWIVNGADAGSRAAAMGGKSVQIGVPVPSTPPGADLSTDAGLCAADAEMTNLELNDALAPLLGYPSDRASRTSEQDDDIRAHKNAAFLRACPERAG